jgi:hypothetical protein
MACESDEDRGARRADLRIYFGDARIMIDRDDPRCAEILAICIRNLPKQNGAGPVITPRNDAEFMAMVRRYAAKAGG